MADWVNNGSCQDLSRSVFPVDPVSALAPTSQAAGNMQAQEGNDNAMTAPGSPPTDNLDDSKSLVEQDPRITPSNKTVIDPATDGKPQASGQAHPGPRRPAWGATARPETTRKPEK